MSAHCKKIHSSWLTWEWNCIVPFWIRAVWYEWADTVNITALLPVRCHDLSIDWPAKSWALAAKWNFCLNCTLKRADSRSSVALCWCAGAKSVEPATIFCCPLRCGELYRLDADLHCYGEMSTNERQQHSEHWTGTGLLRYLVYPYIKYRCMIVCVPLTFRYYWCIQRISHGRRILTVIETWFCNKYFRVRSW
jgi:hypothetical protein